MFVLIASFLPHIFASSTSDLHDPDSLNEIRFLPGHDTYDRIESPLPSTYINSAQLPKAFTWANVNNTDFLTRTLNQHRTFGFFLTCEGAAMELASHSLILCSVRLSLPQFPPGVAVAGLTEL